MGGLFLEDVDQSSVRVAASRTREGQLVLSRGGVVEKVDNLIQAILNAASDIATDFFDGALALLARPDELDPHVRRKDAKGEGVVGTNGQRDVVTVDPVFLEGPLQGRLLAAA